MNTEETKPTTRCRSGTAIGAFIAVFIAVGFAILGISVAVCGAIGVVIGAAMHDMTSGFAWGVTAGAALGSGIICIMALGSSVMIAVGMALSFRERH